MGNSPGERSKIINGVAYAKGDKVRLTLGIRNADALDMILDGKIATIEMIYTDCEDNIHFAVTIDEDPAREMKRELGLYLYYSPAEVSLV